MNQMSFLLDWQVREKRGRRHAPSGMMVSGPAAHPSTCLCDIINIIRSKMAERFLSKQPLISHKLTPFQFSTFLCPSSFVSHMDLPHAASSYQGYYLAYECFSQSQADLPAQPQVQQNLPLGVQNMEMIKYGGRGTGDREVGQSIPRSFSHSLWQRSEWQAGRKASYVTLMEVP